jgi:hypothetical protein
MTCLWPSTDIGQLALRAGDADRTTTHHRTPMHLESVTSIAPTKIRVEDHLLVGEVSIEVA